MRGALISVVERLWSAGARGLAVLGTIALSSLAAVAIAADLPVKSADKSKEWLARSWQTETGLPQNTINCVLQSADGFIWVGTNGGLARFDGLRFTTFGLREGLGAIRITSLAEDSQGTLWIGTSGGGLSYRQNGLIFTLGTADGFPAGIDILALCPDRDGSIWIGTEDGLLRWNGKTLEAIGEDQGLPRKQVRALVLDSQGILWLSMIGESLYHRSDERFVRLEGEGPTGGDVYTLLASRDGSIWAGATAGVLWQRQGTRWQKFDRKNGLPPSNLSSLAENSDGSVWIGSRSNGIFRWHGGQIEHVVSGVSELSDAVSITADREGSIWVGTISGGLNRLAPRMLHYWLTDPTGGPAAATSVAEAADGTLWISTSDKGLQRQGQNGFQRYSDSGISNNFPFLYCTETTADGSLWAAGEQVLYRLRSGEPTVRITDPPIQGDAVRALCADGDDLWLGTYYSALLKYDGSGLRLVAPRNTFPGGITAIACESPDVLWIGTSEGLHRWDHGKIKTWTKRDGFITSSILALRRDPDGTIWIGTMGGGLARLKDGNITSITTQHGLINDVVSQIVADDYGCIWLGSDLGIMRLDRKEVEDCLDGATNQVHPMVFDRDEGMLKEQCSSGHSPLAIKTKDGRLLFPTANGLAEINPREVQFLAARVPRVQIDSVRVNDILARTDGSLTIPPGRARLELRFTAPVLRGAEWVRFRYRLDPLINTWTHASSARVARFEELRPGKYTFSVESTGVDGNWSGKPATLEINVQRHFWQTRWFRLACGAVLLGVSVAATRHYTRRKVLHRVAEMERKRREHEELAHAGRVALLGELSASLAHELKQPLSAIMSNAQAAQRFLSEDQQDLTEVREILTDIVASDRRASEIINRMRALMRKGEAQVKPLSLNANIEQVLLLLRSDLVSRHVRVETDLSYEIPAFPGDDVQLQQVLLNLIVNGCDAMQDTPLESRKLVVSSILDTDGYARVSISDKGTGIPPELLQRVFEPFYSTKTSGFGMGLSICQSIVKSHGGQLWATNNGDGGTTFHFTLAVTGDPTS